MTTSDYTWQGPHEFLKEAEERLYTYTDTTVLRIRVPTHLYLYVRDLGQPMATPSRSAGDVLSDASM